MNPKLEILCKSPILFLLNTATIKNKLIVWAPVRLHRYFCRYSIYWCFEYCVEFLECPESSLITPSIFPGCDRLEIILVSAVTVVHSNSLVLMDFTACIYIARKVFTGVLLRHIQPWPSVRVTVFKSISSYTFIFRIHNVKF